MTERVEIEGGGEYVRADLYQAALAREAKLREALKGIDQIARAHGYGSSRTVCHTCVDIYYIASAALETQ